MINLTKGQLILEDGTIFQGKLFGAEKSLSGEVVFNTSMTGYQEILTDPAYYGQMIMLTNPAAGSYGINRDDYETVTPFARGLIVKELSEEPSNFRSEGTLDDFLRTNNITGISGIDTRQLMRHLRSSGPLRGRITAIEDTKIEQTINELKAMTKEVAVKYTSISKPYVVPGRGKRIVLVDLGMKHGVLRELTKRGCHITVVPYNYSAENISQLKPEGILLSSGPGNPELIEETIQMIRDLVEHLPMFGIGLGHQLIALALGAQVKRAKVGYYGTSYPVKQLGTDQTVMVTQNNSYLVERQSLEQTELQLTHINLNDETVAGLKHKNHPVFSVQFYPEGSPGPEDSIHLFDEFLQLIEKMERE